MHITEGNLQKYLGKEKITFENANEEDEVGIVRGLAWTSVGGELMPIEALVLEGKGTLTETATGESLPIRKGQSLFLPAGTGAYAVTGTDLKCLRTRV